MRFLPDQTAVNFTQPNRHNPKLAVIELTGPPANIHKYHENSTLPSARSYRHPARVSMRRELNKEIPAQNPVLIEFFGLPGSGKSTACAHTSSKSASISREDLSNRWRKQSILRQLGWMLKGLLDFRLVHAGIGLAVAIGGCNWETARRLLRLVILRQQMNAIHHPIILDQGSLQNLWSICIASNQHEPNVRMISRFLAHLWQGKLVSIIFIQVPADIAAARISGRFEGDSRFENLMTNEIIAELLEYEPLPALLLQAAIDAGAHIETIDGTMPVETVAHASKEVVEQIAS
ncbi:hypothetical protein [Altererythrobacter sp. MF3-039]|uniref:hypothetical protein n=1 Tax=Altererythrobacter sp. MF3-039 TaxID=3252901 RepID=UPI00390C660F